MPTRARRRSAALQAALVGDQHAHGDLIGHVDPREHLSGVGELRDHVGAHEARHLEAPQTGAREHVDQLDLVARWGSSRARSGSRRAGRPRGSSRPAAPARSLPLALVHRRAHDRAEAYTRRDAVLRRRPRRDGSGRDHRRLGGAWLRRRDQAGSRGGADRDRLARSGPRAGSGPARALGRAGAARSRATPTPRRRRRRRS